MDYTEDFVAVEGTLAVIQNKIGEFQAIRHVSGNEAKISKIIDELRYILTSKKYLIDEKVNANSETELRKIHLFLVLNTKFVHIAKLECNDVAHLIDIIPPFSKCLLTNVTLNLGLTQFYSECICSLPIEISLELLEECNKCIQKSEPYAMLEQTSLIALGIYSKIYHMPFEAIDRIDSYNTKLIDKFSEILKNYINPVTNQIITWPTVKMYQYMGRAIYEILNLLKICLDMSSKDNFVAPFYNFYKYDSEKLHSVVKSDNAMLKRCESLTECNKILMSVCEANVVAVTLDVFCSWTECKHNNVLLQALVGELAYELSQQLVKFEECGDLKLMLDSIGIKPKTIENIIESADENKIIENVGIANQNQRLWIKAFLKLDFLNSELLLNTFKSVIHICEKEDYVYLLNLGIDKPQMRNIMLENIVQLQANASIEIIFEYFNKFGLNNLYETENFELNLRQLFNKLSCCMTDVPLKEISALLLQNPEKFIDNLLDESQKNVEHITNIVYIFNFIESVCGIYQENQKILYKLIVNKFKTYNFEPNVEACMIKLLICLIDCGVISSQIEKDLIKIIEETEDLKRATFICQLLRELPHMRDNISSIITLVTVLSKLRWNLFTYSQDRVCLASQLICLIHLYKSQLPNEMQVELYEKATLFENKFDSFHIRSETNFLNYVSDGYDKNSNHNEQVCRLMKVLPCCAAEEWNLITKYLIIDKDPLEILKLLIDVILILSEVSKKSSDDLLGLSYCFQQLCIVTKEFIYPLISPYPAKEKLFIKSICRLLKHIPNELHNPIEVALVHMFNFDVLKSMKDDDDFVYSLVAISHLDICKIICSKMA